MLFRKIIAARFFRRNAKSEGAAKKSSDFIQEKQLFVTSPFGPKTLRIEDSSKSSALLNKRSDEDTERSEAHIAVLYNEVMGEYMGNPLLRDSWENVAARESGAESKEDKQLKILVKMEKLAENDADIAERVTDVKKKIIDYYRVVAKFQQAKIREYDDPEQYRESVGPADRLRTMTHEVLWGSIKILSRGLFQKNIDNKFLYDMIDSRTATRSWALDVAPFLTKESEREETI